MGKEGKIYLDKSSPLRDGKRVEHVLQDFTQTSTVNASHRRREPRLADPPAFRAQVYTCIAYTIISGQLELWYGRCEIILPSTSPSSYCGLKAAISADFWEVIEA